MRTHILPLLFAFCASSATAQVQTEPYPVQKVFAAATEKDKTGVFKAQCVNKHLEGMGMHLAKDGTLYVGGISRDAITGRGMFLAAQGQEISNCPCAKFYVGRVADGVKRGKGRCYNADGAIIYEGRFEDDKPVEAYPQTLSSEIYFTEFVSEGARYFGEVREDYPHGFGTLIFDNGDYLISRFEDGIRTGLGLEMSADGGWCTLNVKGGEETVVSSSAEYENLKAQHRALMANVLNQFAQAAVMTVDLVGQIHDISNGGSGGGGTGDDGASGYTTGGGGGSRGGSSGGGAGYNMSEQQAYNSAKSTYARYDSMVSAAKAGTRSASASEISGWQSKMRQLREKWEAKGKSFPHSSNE